MFLAKEFELNSYRSFNCELGGITIEQNGTYYTETLFHRQAGDRYFLRIKRGTKTPSQRISSKKTTSWRIFVKRLSLDEAKAWVQENLGADAYNDIFND